MEQRLIFLDEAYIFEAHIEWVDMLMLLNHQYMLQFLYNLTLVELMGVSVI